MRLINTATLTFEDFSLRHKPPYAILSHTWGDEEITYQDMCSSIKPKHKNGWPKIRETCRLAKDNDHLEYAWVDTCCIDKSSSAELTEAINSMYAWYQGAQKCYVILSDLEPEDGTPKERQIMNSRWWTRGWTLQELLAPKVLEFYDAEWSQMGTRRDFEEAIHDKTGIPKEVLQGDASIDLDGYCVATRMAWASDRSTTRPEDEAYCLLGLFGINMPLIYGEGPKAFRRLQEEIIKKPSDMTILAGDTGPRCGSLLAQSPRGFHGLQSAQEMMTNTSFQETAVTNRGLRISDKTWFNICRLSRGEDCPTDSICYVLKVGSHFVALRIIAPQLYQRHPSWPGFVALQFVRSAGIGEWYVRDSNIYIVIDGSPALHTIIQLSRGPRGIHVPEFENFTLLWSAPQRLWDWESRTFLGHKDYDPEEGLFILGFRTNELARPFTIIIDRRVWPQKSLISSQLASNGVFDSRISSDNFVIAPTFWSEVQRLVDTDKLHSTCEVQAMGRARCQLNVSLRVGGDYDGPWTLQIEEKQAYRRARRSTISHQTMEQ